jgi:KDO2-lipid IV(A) lauroyltransferase
VDKRKTTLARTIAYILEAVAVIALGTIFSRLPRTIIRRFGVLSGRILFRLDRKDRKRAYHNLDIVFKEPHLLPSEKDRGVRRLFENIAALAFEYLRLDRLYAENLAVFLKAENHEAVAEALREKKGVLVITAHLGNWEYLGVLGSRLGYNVAAVLKRQHNPYTDRWLARIREEKGGAKCFYHGRGLDYRIGVHLKQNGILALVADQRDISSRLIVPFFGKPGQTADGPAKLHLWYESPIVFAFSIRQPDGTYLLKFDGPHRFSGSGDRKADCVRIMTFINQKYEAMVRKYPDQWLSLLTPRWEIDKGVAEKHVAITLPGDPD